MYRNKNGEIVLETEDQKDLLWSERSGDGFSAEEAGAQLANQLLAILGCERYCGTCECNPQHEICPLWPKDDEDIG